MAGKKEDVMEKIVSLCKRRGFVYQGSEIYGGLAGTWDYGPLGAQLKANIEHLWLRQFVDSREDMYRIDSAILMNPKVWEASGHTAGFSDPLVQCQTCKKRFRADHLKDSAKCPECKGTLGEPRQFNMMFKTSVGSVDGSDTTVYLRPETAQGMFVNFKNIIDSFHPRLPFGLAQIGRNFRNEIAPR
ncbi:MAG: glycine--tRNA ligase, partial [Patescibacteria group bacterium]|nr:glycine--tRNA ligase [Patescibacteria group bacterium]